MTNFIYIMVGLFEVPLQVCKSVKKDLTPGSEDLQIHSERKVGFSHEQIQTNKTKVPKNLRILNVSRSEFIFI